MKVSIELDNLEMLRVIKDGSLETLLNSIKDENMIDIPMAAKEIKPDVDNIKPTAPPVPPATIPTTVKEYKLDELAKAAVGLMETGKQQDLVNLLQQFGVNALPELDKLKYGEFATRLRGLGADI